MSNFLPSFNFFRESEEMEKRSKEDLEEKRREISELSSDLAAARWGVICTLFKSFLSDPSPVIGYACHSLPNSLTP